MFVQCKLGDDLSLNSAENSSLDEGFFPDRNVVAVAMANKPQLVPPVCF